MAVLETRDPLSKACQCCIQILNDAFMLEIGECIRLVRNIHVYFLECICKIKDTTTDKSLRRRIYNIQLGFGDPSISREQVMCMTHDESRMKQRRALTSRSVELGENIRTLRDRIRQRKNVGAFLLMNSKEGEAVKEGISLMEKELNQLEIEKARINVILQGVWTHSVVYDYLRRFENILEGGNGNLTELDRMALDFEKDALKYISRMNIYDLKRHRRYWERVSEPMSLNYMRDIDNAIQRRKSGNQTRPPVLTPSK